MLHIYLITLSHLGTTLASLFITMMKTLLSALALVVAFTTKVVVSEKDNNYYPPGYSNPNVNKAMYWRDSVNVLQDLSSFDKLYVKYHSCAYVPTLPTALCLV
jgi:hypothetical protein